MKLGVTPFCCVLLACVNASTDAGHTVEANRVVEIELQSFKTYENPFTEIELDVIVTEPSGKQLSVPGFWDGDQLYDLQADPGELNNLAADPQYAAQLKTMRQRLTEDLQAHGRPFGEFVPGGNAAPGGEVDDPIARVKTLTIKGKTVIGPKNRDAMEASTTRKESRQSQRRNRKPNR